MRRMATLAGSVFLALVAAPLALAGTATGTTTILGPTGGAYDGLAHADTPTDVELSISTGAPVVPYQYSLINKCWFDGKASGPSDSFERFDLAGPWYEPFPDAPPTMTVSVNVQPVPASSVCNVYLVKNNTVLKGSLTKYSVVP